MHCVLSDVLSSWPDTMNCAIKNKLRGFCLAQSTQDYKICLSLFCFNTCEKKHKTVMWHTKGSGVSLFRSWQSWTAGGNQAVALPNTCQHNYAHWLHPSEMVNQLNLTKQLSKPEGSICYRTALSPPCDKIWEAHVLYCFVK